MVEEEEVGNPPPLLCPPRDETTHRYTSRRNELHLLKSHPHCRGRHSKFLDHRLHAVIIAQFTLGGLLPGDREPAAPGLSKRHQEFRSKGPSLALIEGHPGGRLCRSGSSPPYRGLGHLPDMPHQCPQIPMPFRGCGMWPSAQVAFSCQADLFCSRMRSPGDSSGAVRWNRGRPGCGSSLVLQVRLSLFWETISLPSGGVFAHLARRRWPRSIAGECVACFPHSGVPVHYCVVGNLRRRGLDLSFLGSRRFLRSTAFGNGADGAYRGYIGFVPLVPESLSHLPGYLSCPRNAAFPNRHHEMGLEGHA